MKFCYLDESGAGEEPFAVMVGIIVDAQRMQVTKKHWQELLAILTQRLGQTVTEIHTKDFYAGNGIWRDLDGEKRKKIIDAILIWLKEDRKHSIVFSTLNKQKFNDDLSRNEKLKDIGSIWRFLGLHICLAIQKEHQKLKVNKGNTVLIFDNKFNEMEKFTGLLNDPPSWTDAYYSRSPKKPKFDQIIDVPYWGDSKTVGLIQVADFMSYFIRRYIELKEGQQQEKYTGERDQILGWFSKIKEMSISCSIYPKRNICDCSRLFIDYAPSCIINP